MEMLMPFRHTPIVSHTLSKSIKSRPGFIVSVTRIHERTHETRKNRNWPSQQEIHTVMTPKKSFEIDSRKTSSELPLLEKIFDTLDRAIIKFIDPPLHLSVDPSYILSDDNYAPVHELSPTECKVVHGSIPKCLDGVYIRNGPNPQFVPNGPHHYLDGDGMVHSIRISQGQATFCSRYVKTNKYLFEHQARSCVVPKIGGMQTLGPFVARVALFFARIISGKYDIDKGIGVANTNLAFFGGSLYALCESDLPYTIKVQKDGDIITLGQHDFNGKLSKNMTAHPKIDPETKEAFAFRYWSIHPFLTYFRFDANGNKQPDVPIFSMKQPSLTHDLAITNKYAVIFDSQLGADPMNLIRGGQFVSVDTAKVPRIGLLPRYARDDSDMKWFDVPGFNIFHVVNAWDEIDEDGNDVVTMVAPNILTMEHFIKRMDLMQASMEKVTIQIGTGVVSRQTLSTDNLELPVINPAYASKKNKYIYAAIYEKAPSKSRMLRIIGVSKLDTSSDQNSMEPHEHTVACRLYGDSCYGGEPFFVARDPENLSSEEDDGYVVSYVHDETLCESRFLVMDARSPTLEIVAAVKLPQRVPYGLHGIFIRGRDLVTTVT